MHHVAVPQCTCLARETFSPARLAILSQFHFHSHEKLPFPRSLSPHKPPSRLDRSPQPFYERQRASGIGSCTTECSATYLKQHERPQITGRSVAIQVGGVRRSCSRISFSSRLTVDRASSPKRRSRKVDVMRSGQGWACCDAQYRVVSPEIYAPPKLYGMYYSICSVRLSYFEAGTIVPLWGNVRNFRWTGIQ